MFGIPVNEEFLVDGVNCKIPNLSPFSKEAMSVFKREEPELCLSKRPWTTIIRNYETNEMKLFIRDHLSSYKSGVETKVRSEHFIRQKSTIDFP